MKLQLKTGQYFTLRTKKGTVNTNFKRKQAIIYGKNTYHVTNIYF